jgi:hypothetical protein
VVKRALTRRSSTRPPSRHPEIFDDDAFDENGKFSARVDEALIESVLDRYQAGFDQLFRP